MTIVIWKENRAKTQVSAKLRRPTIEDGVTTLATQLYFADSVKDRLNIIMEEWGFYLPMATAILTVLFPEEFGT